MSLPGLPNLEFANREFLLLLALLPALALVYWRWVWRRRRTVRFSDVATARRVARPWMRWLPHLPFLLRLLALALLVLALARPRSGVTFEDVSSEGVDIILTVDVSTSMLAEDLRAPPTG